MSAICSKVLSVSFEWFQIMELYIKEGGVLRLKREWGGGEQSGLHSELPPLLSLGSSQFDHRAVFRELASTEQSSL